MIANNEIAICQKERKSLDGKCRKKKQRGVGEIKIYK